jgi:hypothetical protein
VFAHTHIYIYIYILQPNYFVSYINIIVFCGDRRCYRRSKGSTFHKFQNNRNQWRKMYQSTRRDVVDETSPNILCCENFTCHVVQKLGKNECVFSYIFTNKNKQSLLRLFHKGVVPTDRTSLVCEVNANSCRKKGVVWSAQRVLKAVNLCCIDRSCYILFK